MARAAEVKCQLTERLKKPAGLTFCVPCQFLRLNRSSSLDTKTPTLQAIDSARNLQSFGSPHAPSAIRTPIASGVKSVVFCWYLAKKCGALSGTGMRVKLKSEQHHFKLAKRFSRHK